MMNCKPTDWLNLRDADEQSDEYKQFARHVEECTSCSSRLLKMAETNDPWWPDAKNSWLSEELPSPAELVDTQSVLIELDDTRRESDQAETIDQLASFFDRAAHPELLGRIGRYDVERIVGRGGMGIVLKGYDSELHRAVAIKVLAPHLAGNASARRRFAREARAAAAVVHPHVIPIHDVESEGKLPYLVMQFVSGQSLQSRVEMDGSMSVVDVLRVAQQTASGLAAAHAQGLVHRDVKPANILMEENVERALLSDFGLARAADDASLTRTGVIAGTPHYMSPEQAKGKNIDARSDLFGLGSVMYFMLTGHPPFRADGAMAILHRICHESHRPVEQVNTVVPYEVARLVDRLLAKQASERFGSAEQVETECRDLLATIQTGGLSLRKRGLRRGPTIGTKKVSRWLTWLILLAIICIFPLMLVPNWRGNRENDSKPKHDLNIKELTVRELREVKSQFDSLEAEAAEWEKSLQNSSKMIGLLRKDLQSSSALRYEDDFWQEANRSLKVLSQVDLDQEIQKKTP